MGLKCLLGHDFGEREVERDRREEGDEVVVVYRTVENCRRCGTRRVVSENKEVRSIRDAAAAAAGSGGSADPADAARDAGEQAPTTADGDAAEGATVGADADADPPAGSLIEAAEAVGARDGDDAAETDGEDPEDDDAVILGGTPDADADADAKANAEVDVATPDADADADAGADADTEEATAGSGAELLDAGAAGSDGSDGHGAWPTPDGDAGDEGYDATPHEDAETDVDFGGGLAPTDTNHAAYVGTDDADDAGDGFVRAERREAAADGPTEFRCPNCGTTRPVDDSSLRAGDVCPDCRKGYVAERSVGE
ncbi:MAG: hypothetical protein ABEJ34_03725 [Haloferacaceae archaeon]